VKSTLPGVNIQHPISTLIAEGKKTVETRTYPMPESYVGQKILIIETPGPGGKFKSRAIAIAIFGPSFKYKSKAEFYSDFEKHKVSKDSKWAWKDKPKWGWPILEIVPIKEPFSINGKKGMRFTRSISVSGQV
jgi:hypothetical protein